MFIRLYELARQQNSEVLRDFCADVLRLYERYGINDHIKWK